MNTDYSALQNAWLLVDTINSVKQNKNPSVQSLPYVCK